MMSQVKRKVTSCAALALAAALGLGALSMPARALEYVDTSLTGSLTITLSEDALEEYRANLAEPYLEGESTSIPVQVFQVAAINQGGSYTAIDGSPFSSLDIAETFNDVANWNTDYWVEAIAALVTDIYGAGALNSPGEDGAETPEETETPPTAAPDLSGATVPTVKAGSEPVDDAVKAEMQIVTLTAGENYSKTLTNLPLGLYLIVPLTTDTYRYEYRFAPALVSVPQIETAADSSETWQYNVTTYLKPEREQRLGQLVIHKALADYSATFEGASFVFEVTATLEGEMVYHNFHELTFQQANSGDDIVIPDLPVGAAVTVTEVYSGASYHLTAGTQTQNVTVPPLNQPRDDGQNWKPYPDGEGNPTAAYTYFENSYDHRFNGGTGAENIYKQTETKEADGSTGTHWAKPYQEGSETTGGQTTEGGTGE